MAEQLELNVPLLENQPEQEVGDPAADQPEMQEIEEADPAANQPEIQEIEAADPAADQPEMQEIEAADPAANQPEMQEIEAADPAANQPEIQEIIEEADPAANQPEIQEIIEAADPPTSDLLKPEVFHYKPVPRVIYYVVDALQLAVDRGDVAVARDKNLDLDTVFHSSSYTDISIEDYLLYIHDLVECSSSCYVVAYIYLDRLATRYPHPPITSGNAHCLLLAAVHLAVKFLHGRRYTNKYFATVGQVSLVEMNEMEQQLMFALNYTLHVSTDDFLYYKAFLDDFEDDNGCCCFSM